MKTKALILIIDDDPAVCASLNLLFSRAGFDTLSAAGPEEALTALPRRRPDLAVLDMNFSLDTSGRQGLELLRGLQALHPGLPVILLTGWGTLDLAVAGMKAGAADFLTKPWDNARLLESARTALALRDVPAADGGLDESFGRIVGQSAALKSVLQVAQRVSRTDASVLILGESGTGKELLAEAIHFASHRARKPFVKVNLGGISASLFESEMFGHKRGAFTGAVDDREGRFERADGGTIFLDEIGDLDPASQVKLLRVLQDQTFEKLGSSQPRKVNVRIISATHAGLQERVGAGAFREDLFYRINLITLQLPSLRDRPGDIPLLTDFYLGNLRELYSLPRLSITPAARQWLQAQRFPGNIRQLKNLVERTVLVSSRQVLDREDFERQYDADAAPSGVIRLPKVGEITLDELEKQMILKALEHHQHNIQRAARALGITRAALYRRLAKYQIPHDPQG
ncbi:MAG: sigma-54 dependent transcriptional regulator [Bacteroidia bacterium]|nr:sigma-54 dependent transcriptional regulator [Bacteroidia bacterium]